MDKDFKWYLISIIICLPIIIWSATNFNKSDENKNSYLNETSGLNGAMNLQMDAFLSVAKRYYGSKNDYTDICNNETGFLKMLKLSSSDSTIFYTSCSSNKDNWAVCVAINTNKGASPGWTSMANYCADGKGNRVRVSNETCKQINVQPSCK